MPSKSLEIYCKDIESEYNKYEFNWTKWWNDLTSS